MIGDVANQVLANPTWDPANTITPWNNLLPAHALLDSTLPYATACKLDVSPPTIKHHGKCDVCIDDIIIVSLYTQQLVTCLTKAVAVAIHCMFCPIQKFETSFRSPVLSLRTLAGEGVLCEIKTILGWIVNMRPFMVHLSLEKTKSWLTNIKRLLASGCTNRKDLEKLIGRLNHVCYIF